MCIRDSSYTIDIQNGTVIGTLPIGVPEQPGATLFGEITDLLSVGNAGDSYNPVSYTHP